MEGTAVDDGAGIALPDFTNPEATAWYVSKLRALLEMGVDAFKNDFGERIPTDVVWRDGSDPQRMHNYYTHLYNQAVFDLLREVRGEGEAVLFARSATAGGQQFPVHWGGDSESTFASMAETLRGGLSLAMSGFAYPSHDIGGFEGTPDAEVFKRWIAFGMLSSHSRFHGSGSYRVPWLFDEEAVEAQERGTPIMRPMVLAFPDDPACATIDTQYLLGPDLPVAPVFSASGDVAVYLPEGTWTHLLTHETVTGPRWVRENHGPLSLPLYVRPGAVIARSSRADRPEGYADDVVLQAFELGDAEVAVRVPERAAAGAPTREFGVAVRDGVVRVACDGAWRAEAYSGGALVGEPGTMAERLPAGFVLSAEPTAPEPSLRTGTTGIFAPWLRTPSTPRSTSDSPSSISRWLTTPTAPRRRAWSRPSSPASAS